MAVTYPLDLSGVSPANLVPNELHAVNEAHFKDYYFIVPNFAPFYIDNFQASVIVNGVTRPLTEDVDFSFALPYVTGTRTTGKGMYGAITLNNLDLNGLIKINYQTVGGDQIADRLTVLTVLADKAYNPRTTIWDILTNVPTAFPPVPHYQDYDNFYGQEQLVNALIQIRDAILTNSSMTSEKLAEFLNLTTTGTLTGFVNKTGDTVTGTLQLLQSPVNPLDAVNKDYVDNHTVSVETFTSTIAEYKPAAETNTELSNKLNVTGGTMTGPLTLNADPTLDSEAVTKRYVDTIKTELVGTISQAQELVNQATTGLVTKQYVDDRFNELMIVIQTSMRSLI